MSTGRQEVHPGQKEQALDRAELVSRVWTNTRPCFEYISLFSECVAIRQVVNWSFWETINYFILPTSFNEPGLVRMRCLHGIMALQVPWKPVSNTCSDDTWSLGKQLRALLALKRLIAIFFRHGHLAISITSSLATQVVTYQQQIANELRTAITTLGNLNKTPLT